MKKKVLIVEDYADVRKIMEIVIRLRGYDVIEATDGIEAIEQTKQHNPDLILMDLAMPIIDGFTATQIIREFEDYKETPIIALSAYGNSYSKKAMEAGCNEVINKPLDFDRLETIFNEYL